jgi:hypothetical protein
MDAGGVAQVKFISTSASLRKYLCQLQLLMICIDFSTAAWAKDVDCHLVVAPSLLANCVALMMRRRTSIWVSKSSAQSILPASDSLVIAALMLLAI